MRQDERMETPSTILKLENKWKDNKTTIVNLSEFLTNPIFKTISEVADSTNLECTM